MGDTAENKQRNTPLSQSAVRVLLEGQHAPQRAGGRVVPVYCVGEVLSAGRCAGAERERGGHSTVYLVESAIFLLVRSTSFGRLVLFRGHLRIFSKIFRAFHVDTKHEGLYLAKHGIRALKERKQVYDRPCLRERLHIAMIVVKALLQA
jgi:hypothetical protein